jgi:hypothetical protein
LSDKNPNDRGAKKLTAKYGNRLIGVRYRYDEGKSRRFTTVELIEEEVAWKPKIAKDKLMRLKITWDEKEVREQVKAAGGRWNKTKKLLEESIYGYSFLYEAIWY